MSLQQSNLQRVKDLVAEFQQGNPAGYLAGVADDIKGSILGGLIPGGDDVRDKAQFMGLMGEMEKYMEVKKFEPYNWRAVGDDVLFNVDWQFVWKPTGKEVETTAIVRKVLKDGCIAEKYHMVDVEAITGEKPPHDVTNLERIKELMAEYLAGRPEGYLAGVADDIKGSILGGLIPGGDDVRDKAQFMGLMGEMEKYMEVKKFEPANYHALPNGDVMFNVFWQFVWKPTGKEVETTAVVRKVLKDGCIAEKYHMVDVDAVLQMTSPRDVITDAAA